MPYHQILQFIWNPKFLIACCFYIAVVILGMNIALADEGEGGNGQDEQAIPVKRDSKDKIDGITDRRNLIPVKELDKILRCIGGFCVGHQLKGPRIRIKTNPLFRPVGKGKALVRLNNFTGENIRLLGPGVPKKGVGRGFHVSTSNVGTVPLYYRIVGSKGNILGTVITVLVPGSTLTIQVTKTR